MLHSRNFFTILREASFIKGQARRKVIFILTIFFALGFAIFSFSQIQAFIFKKQIKIREENIQKQIQNIEKDYKNDIYGAETPEKTYQLFLEALQNKDIDLASKYFILEKQEEYKKLLTQIENNGQWEEMMDDLMLSKNQQGKYQDKETYMIEIINDKNESVSTIIFKIPIIKFGTDIKKPSNIWKIFNF